MPDVPLRLLADRLAIDDLVARYTMAVDDRAWDRLDGDHADVRAYFLNPLVIDRPDGPWQMDVGGVYHHELVRTPDGWRSRRLHEELVWDRRL
jgi:hypothetical protein